MNYIILLPGILSGLAGIGLCISSFADHRRMKPQESEEKTDTKENKTENRAETARVHLISAGVLILSAVLALYAAWSGEKSLVLFYFTDEIPIYFHIDALGRLFITVISLIWTAVCIYAFVYMKHEGEEKRFFGFYLLVYGVLTALCFAGNLITFYFFYELMTLCSAPLVLHNGSKEAIIAALKYIFYSMLGAYCALFGIYFLYHYCDTLTFTAGGTLNTALAAENKGILLVAVFIMIIGFGTKAGMLPFHAWLPTAHPVAPTPASAVLSAVIVKAGVLAVIRSIYYIAGPDFIKGTWVQTAWLILSLVTVFMGSLLAYRENVFKKRLAYSTVSQVSYIMFGLALLTRRGIHGALLHVVFHAFIKCALFLAAGIFILRTGKTKADEYAGIGKQQPLTLWAYTFASLALIGIPPTSGFVSKWYLAMAALRSNTAGIFRFLGPVVLLISALLTAGYLLPITMKGFLPGEDLEVEAKKEPVDKMTVVLLILAAVTLLLGIRPNSLISYGVSLIAAEVFQ